MGLRAELDELKARIEELEAKSTSYETATRKPSRKASVTLTGNRDALKGEVDPPGESGGKSKP